MKTLARFPATTSPEIIIAALDRDGAVIVEGLLSAETVAQVNKDLDPFVAAADPAMRHVNDPVTAFFGPKVRHVSGMTGKSKIFAENVMCHPLMLVVCDHVLLPNCADYRLNLAHLMDRGPGSERQYLHRDEDIHKYFPQPRPQIEVSSVVALVDFTKENGATAVVPGSHQWPRDREATEDEIAYAEMKAGSAIIYLGSTVHAGGSNTTDSEWRRGFHMSYVLGWLRTEDNNVLATPPAVARQLSPRAQRLVGYGIHDAIAIGGGYLGLLDMRDPQELLNEGALG